MLARAREHGATQDEDLPVAKLIPASVERPVDAGERGVQVLIDRGADDADQEPALTQAVGLVLDLQRPGRQRAGEHVRGLVLEKGHPPLPDHPYLVGIDVVDHGFQPAIRERERKGEGPRVPRHR